MTFTELMNDMTFTQIMWWITVLFTVVFFVYVFSKEARDEHGRAILGSACLIGVISLFVFINILTGFTYTVTQNPVFFSNAIRLMFDSFLLVVFVSILILRKLR